MTRTVPDRDTQLAYLRIDAATAETLRGFRQTLNMNIDKIVNRFYDHLLKFDEVRRIFGANRDLKRLKAAQCAHWSRLFDGRFDGDYAKSAADIGRAHERHGVLPVWYLGGYGYFLDELTGLVIDTCGTDLSRQRALLQAIHRVVFLDMTLALSVYGAAHEKRVIAEKGMPL